MSRVIYDKTKVKDPLHKRSFSRALKNRFEALDNDHHSVDDAWTEYKDIYNRTTAAETLGQRAWSRKDWANPSTWNCIGERRKLKQSILNCRSERARGNRQWMYRREDKYEKKRARADKRRALESRKRQKGQRTKTT